MFAIAFFMSSNALCCTSAHWKTWSFRVNLFKGSYFVVSELSNFERYSIILMVRWCESWGAGNSVIACTFSSSGFRHALVSVWPIQIISSVRNSHLSRLILIFLSLYLLHICLQVLVVVIDGLVRVVSKSFNQSSWIILTPVTPWNCSIIFAWNALLAGVILLGSI